MSVRLYIRDNTDGSVHEYGTNRHDSLILQEDGSIHYDNMQNGTGTMLPEEGYTFVLPDGTDPRTDKDLIAHGCEPLLDIGGEEHGNACETCIYNGKRYQKCTTCRDNNNLKSRYKPKEVVL